MRPRTVLTFGVLACAAAAPVIFTNRDAARDPLAQQPENPFGFATARSGTSDGLPPAIGASPGQYHQPLFEGVADFRDVFRFDVGPNWVKSRWPRVSKCPGEDGLDGLRVALVTGTAPYDLQGSLTYFFDDDLRLQRIAFRGWTGESDRLVSFVQREFQLQPVPSSAGGFYVLKNWGTIKSVLKLNDFAVTRREYANHQLTVLLEINHPRQNYSLSQQMAAALKAP